MVGQPEDRRPVRRVVAADAFEHPGAVVEAVRTHVDRARRPSRRARRSSRSCRWLARAPPLIRVGLRTVATADEIGVRAPSRAAAGRPGRSAPGARASRRRSRPRRAGAASARSGPRDARCGNGATAPGSKPVASSDLVRIRDPHVAAPTAAATFASSARRSPGISARTYSPSQTKTSDLTICSSRQPTARAASSAVGVPSGNSSIVASMRPAGTTTTRSTGSGHMAGA